MMENKQDTPDIKGALALVKNLDKSSMEVDRAMRILIGKVEKPLFFTSNLQDAWNLLDHYLPDENGTPNGNGWKFGVTRLLYPGMYVGWCRRHADDGAEGHSDTPALSLLLAASKAIEAEQEKTQ